MYSMEGFTKRVLASISVVEDGLDNIPVKIGGCKIPLDYYLQGHVKPMVYRTEPANANYRCP
jgi:hypothetical protein